MNSVKKIAKNTGFLFLGRIFTKIISLFSVIFIVRYLGEIGYGKYAFAFAFISFFTILAELGVHSILVREVSRSSIRAPQLVGNAIIISTVFSTAAFLLAIASIGFLGYPEETINVVKIASLGLLFGILSPLGVIYETELKMKYSVFFGLASRIFLLISILFITGYDWGLNWLVLVTVLSDGIHYLLMALYSKKLLTPCFKFDTATCRFLLKESLPLAFASVFLIIYFRIDVVMLSLMKGDADVGVYSSAYRITESFIFLPSTLMVSIFPLLSKYHSGILGNKGTLLYTYLKSFKILFTTALCLALGISFFSKEIISLLYGNQVQGASVTLQILIWATSIIFVNYSFGQFLVSINKQKITTISTAICAIFNILLNFIMIPHWGYNGAAIATVATELLSSFIMVFYIRSSIPLSTLFGEIKKPLLITLTCYLIFVLFNNYVNVFISFIFMVCVYFYSMYFFGGLNEDDLQLLKKLRT